MESQISTLLSSTYSGSNDTVIKNAQNTLFQNITHPDFFPSLLNIILNPSNPVNLRISGITFLNNSILSLWDLENSPFTHEIRKYIFQFIPQIIKASLPQVVLPCTHLTVDVIKKTYLTNEWPEIYSEIINGFTNENEDGEILCSLILSNSLFSVFLLINKKTETNDIENLKNANQIFVQFIIQNLIQLVSNTFHQKNGNIQLITYCYQLIKNLFKFDGSLLHQIFNSNSILSSLVQEMVQYSFRIKEITSNDPLFELFIKKVMKFLSICYSNPNLANFIGIEFISNFLPVIQEILKSALPNPIKCSTLRFLSGIFSNETVWKAVGEENTANTLVNIISPLFAISADDFKMAYDDPSGFICENQKICDFDDFNDLKASSSNILFKCAKKHDILLSICISSIANSYQMFVNNQTDNLNLFSIFHMSSNVINLAANKNSNAVLSLFGEIYPLFELDNNNINNQFATAASFLLLSSCTNLKYSKELIHICFVHVDNPFKLTRYYAIECISSILRQITADPSLSSIKDEIFNQYGEKLAQTFQILLSISREASIADLIGSFTHFFSIFGEKLLPLSQTLVTNFLEIINDITSTNNDDFPTLIMVIQSFSSFLAILSKSEQISAQLLPTIYHSLVQLFKNIPDSAIDSYLSLFKEIILKSPLFIQSYWEITSIFTPEYSKEFNQLIELIEFKEIEMPNDQPAIEFMVNFINNSLRQINDFDEFQNYCPAFSGFVLRLKQDVITLNGGDLFVSIVQKIVPLIQFLFNQENEGNNNFNNYDIVKLLNALFIVDASLVLNVCGDAFPVVFTYWQQKLTFPLSVPAAINALNLEQINDEQKSILLSSVLNLAFNSLIYKSNLSMMKNLENDGDDDDYDDLDFDDFEEVTENCPWFSDQEAVSLLIQFFNANQQNPSLFVKCDPSQVQFLNEYQKNIES